jgi:hypothetical protein
MKPYTVGIAVLTIMVILTALSIHTDTKPIFAVYTLYNSHICRYDTLADTSGIYTIMVDRDFWTGKPIKNTHKNTVINKIW